MGLINKGWADEGLTLKTSAKHYIPQAKNIPLLIKPAIFSVVAHAEKQVFFETSLPVFMLFIVWRHQ